VPSPSPGRPACYIASPCGFAESTRLWYRTVLVPLVAARAEVLDPWSVDTSHIVSAAPGDAYELSVDLGLANYRTIAERADLLVAVLDQEPPDNGTVAEVAWAAAHEVPVIGYRGDLRASGEPGMPYNLMVSAAIRHSGGAEVSSLEALQLELERVTRNLIEQRVAPRRPEAG
jgi:nucleoside 2-deoxyribosyltransferase